MRKHLLGLFAVGVAVAIAAPVSAQQSTTHSQSSTSSSQSTQQSQRTPGTSGSDQTANTPDNNGTTGDQTTRGSASMNSAKENKDHMFLRKAAQDNVNEVHVAKMAEDRSSSQAVKDFARKLVTDHTNTAQQVASLAQTEGITVATLDNTGGSDGTSGGTAAKSTTDQSGTNQSGSSSSANSSTGSTSATSSSSMNSNGNSHMMGKLANLTGADFDRQFVKMQVRDHEKDIKEFEKAANDSKMSSEVRNLAQQTLPTLREHLQMAKSLENQVGSGSGSNSKSTSSNSGSSTGSTGTTGTSGTDTTGRGR